MHSKEDLGPIAETAFSSEAASFPLVVFCDVSTTVNESLKMNSTFSSALK